MILPTHILSDNNARCHALCGDDVACAHIKMPESGFATLENGQLPPLDRQIGTAGSSGFLLGLRSTIRWESEQSESNKCASADTDSPESKRHPSYIGGTTTLHDTTKERADSGCDEITVHLFPYCTENQFP